MSGGGGGPPAALTGGGLEHPLPRLVPPLLALQVQVQLHARRLGVAHLPGGGCQLLAGVFAAPCGIAESCAAWL